MNAGPAGGASPDVTNHVWRSISEVPENWRPFFVRYARQGLIPLRARQFNRFQISDEDRKKLAERFNAYVYARQDSLHSSANSKPYGEWEAAERRLIPVQHTLMNDYHLTESMWSDDFLDNWDWDLAAHQRFSGPANLDRQQPGYSMFGIEFDMISAAAVGFPPLANPSTIDSDGSASSSTQSAATEPVDVGSNRRMTAEPLHRGRPQGSGSFALDDAPLLDRMKALIDSGQARSVTAAAKLVVGEAAGPSTEASKLDRLRKGFMSRERNGG